MAVDDCNHCQVEPAIWKACAGTSFEIPPEQSRVYYFPQGHMEHSSDPQSVLPLVSRLPPNPYLLCRVMQVLYLADSKFGEVYVKIRLNPLDESLCLSHPDPPPSVSSDDGVVLSFAKVLTLSDANNGGGFSVPRSCAVSIFPPLDYEGDPPVQTLTMTDLRGETWNFRHIYRGTPRRHLLTTGWSKFVNSKSLVSNDAVVFMKNNLTGKLFLGVRKANRSNAESLNWEAVNRFLNNSSGAEETKKGKISVESVAKALNLAMNKMPFEVIYYPGVASPEFVVSAVKVDGAMSSAIWSAGIRVRIAQEADDSSRKTWFEGTVSSLAPPEFGTWQWSPWKMLQVTWDKSEILKKMEMERVSPWQVELVPLTPSIDPQFPSSKKLRFDFMSKKETKHPITPNTGMTDSVVNPSCFNIFPDSIQGARQNTYVSNTFPVSECEVLERTMAVSTDLNLQSYVIPPARSSSIVLSRRDPKTIQLFGNTIDKDSPVGSPKQNGRHDATSSDD